jgi:hypothetical protein
MPGQDGESVELEAESVKLDSLALELLHKRS